MTAHRRYGKSAAFLEGRNAERQREDQRSSREGSEMLSSQILLRTSSALLLRTTTSQELQDRRSDRRLVIEWSRDERHRSSPMREDKTRSTSFPSFGTLPLPASLLQTTSSISTATKHVSHRILRIFRAHRPRFRQAAAAADSRRLLDLGSPLFASLGRPCRDQGLS